MSSHIQYILWHTVWQLCNHKEQLSNCCSVQASLTSPTNIHTLPHTHAAYSVACIECNHQADRRDTTGIILYRHAGALGSTPHKYSIDEANSKHQVPHPIVSIGRRLPQWDRTGFCPCLGTSPSEMTTQLYDAQRSSQDATIYIQCTQIQHTSEVYLI